MSSDLIEKPAYRFNRVTRQYEVTSAGKNGVVVFMPMDKCGNVCPAAVPQSVPPEPAVNVEPTPEPPVNEEPTP